MCIIQLWSFCLFHHKRASMIIWAWMAQSLARMWKFILKANQLHDHQARIFPQHITTEKELDKTENLIFWKSKMNYSDFTRHLFILLTNFRSLHLKRHKQVYILTEHNLIFRSWIPKSCHLYNIPLIHHSWTKLEEWQ